MTSPSLGANQQWEFFRQICIWPNSPVDKKMYFIEEKNESYRVLMIFNYLLTCWDFFKGFFYSRLLKCFGKNKNLGQTEEAAQIPTFFIEKDMLQIA